jgi:WD40 repeat protein
MGHGGRIALLSTTPDDQFLVSADAGSSVLLWHLASGKEIMKISPFDRIQAVSLHPGGRTVLIAVETDGDMFHICGLLSGETIKSIAGIKGQVNTLAWSPDGKLFAAGYLDGYIRIWNSETGEYLHSYVSHGASVTALVWSADGQDLYSGSYDGSLERWKVGIGTMESFAEKQSGLVRSFSLSPDGRQLAVSWGWGGVSLWDTRDLAKTWEIPEQANPQQIVNSLAFSPDGRELALGYSSSPLRIVRTDNGGKLGSYTPDMSFFATSVCWSRDGKTLFAGNKDGLIQRIARADLKMVSRFANHNGGAGALAFSDDGRYLAAAGSSDGVVRLWDLETGSPTLFPGAGSSVDDMTFSPDGSRLATGDNQGMITIRDWNKRSVVVARNPGKGSVLGLEYSPDGKAVYVLYPQGRILCLAADTLELIKDYGKLGGLMGIDLTPDGKTLVMTAGTDGVFRMDIKSGKLAKPMKEWGDFNLVEISPDGKYAATGTWHGVLFIWDIKKGTRFKRIVAHGNGVYPGYNPGSSIVSLVWAPDGKGIFTGGRDRSVRYWVLSTGNKAGEWTGHGAGVEALACSRDGQWIASGAFDTTVRLNNRKNGKRVILHSGAGQTANQWLIRTEQGFWDGSRDCGDLVAMVRGTNVWNIDQFAVRNNRPDLILEELGSRDTERIANLNALYLRRLRRLKITESSLGIEMPVPVTELKSVRQEGKSLHLQLEFHDAATPLLRYQVFVNDVPLFGAEGKPLSGKKGAAAETIELTTGDNKIEVSCLNSAGLESWRVVTRARYDKPVQPDLYFLAFGVSVYNDPVITDLGFAAKDALDLENRFQAMAGGSFRKVHTRVYTDSQVTRAAVTGAKSFLDGSRPDDVLVLFIAGHGTYIRGDDPVYYYITSDARLADLPGTAVPFDLVEGLLQGIPPRKKLFLMDTCESGESDWGVPEAAGDGAPVRGLTARSMDSATLRGFKVLGRPAPVVEERERYISNDLVRRSGAIVFSSSRGNEYSLESVEWEQGAFTREILQAFQTPSADLDRNGTLSIRELQAFVSDEVPKLTGNRQHPTVDRDNIFIDFGFPVR